MRSESGKPSEPETKPTPPETGPGSVVPADKPLSKMTREERTAYIQARMAARKKGTTPSDTVELAQDNPPSASNTVINAGETRTDLPKPEKKSTLITSETGFTPEQAAKNAEAIRNYGVEAGEVDQKTRDAEALAFDEAREKAKRDQRLAEIREKANRGESLSPVERLAVSTDEAEEKGGVFYKVPKSTPATSEPKPASESSGLPENAAAEKPPTEQESEPMIKDVEPPEGINLVSKREDSLRLEMQRLAEEEYQKYINEKGITKEQYITEKEEQIFRDLWVGAFKSAAAQFSSEREQKRFEDLRSNHKVLSGWEVENLLVAGWSVEEIKNVKHGFLSSKIKSRLSDKPLSEEDFDSSIAAEISKSRDDMKKTARQDAERLYEEMHRNAVDKYIERITKENQIKQQQIAEQEAKKQAILAEEAAAQKAKEEATPEEVADKVKRAAYLWQQTYKIDKFLRRKRKSLDNLKYKKKVDGEEKEYSGKEAKEEAKADKNQMSIELVKLAEELSARNFRRDAEKIKKRWSKKDLEKYITDEVEKVLTENGITFTKESSMPEAAPDDSEKIEAQRRGLLYGLRIGYMGSGTREDNEKWKRLNKRVAELSKSLSSRDDAIQQVAEEEMPKK